MTVVMAAVIVEHGQDPAIVFTVVMMAGAFQILLGVLGIGRYMTLLPMPVISGFMTGVGCIIITLQLPPLLGHAALPSVSATMSTLPQLLARPNYHALALGGLSFATIMLEPRWMRRFVPPPLLAI